MHVAPPFIWTAEENRLWRAHYHGPAATVTSVHITNASCQSHQERDSKRSLKLVNPAIRFIHVTSLF